MFSICYDSLAFYEYFTSILQNADFKTYEDQFTKDTEKETVYRRRTAQVLQKPTRSFWALVKKSKDKET